jgi:FtsZ-interacting cell division protein ZipA
MHCTEAFNQMVQVARQMEIGLNAVLVDDNNRPLGDMQIEKIRQQLKVIYATMLVRGIVPGSDSARRLFS